MDDEKEKPFGDFVEMADQDETVSNHEGPVDTDFVKIDGYACHECGIKVEKKDIQNDGRFLCKECKSRELLGFETECSNEPNPTIKVRFHGLMPEHQKEAFKMVLEGIPLGEIADHFGMARSDIVYTNKVK